MNPDSAVCYKIVRAVLTLLKDFIRKNNIHGRWNPLFKSDHFLSALFVISTIWQSSKQLFFWEFWLVIWLLCQCLTIVYEYSEYVLTIGSSEPFILVGSDNQVRNKTWNADRYGRLSLNLCWPNYVCLDFTLILWQFGQHTRKKIWQFCRLLFFPFPVGIWTLKRVFLVFWRGTIYP